VLVGLSGELHTYIHNYTQTYRAFHIERRIGPASYYDPKTQALSKTLFTIAQSNVGNVLSQRDGGNRCFQSAVLKAATFTFWASTKDISAVALGYMTRAIVAKVIIEYQSKLGISRFTLPAYSNICTGAVLRCI
jgi:hypothetical protein